MKSIHIVIPCYNEVENISEICDAVLHVCDTQLSNYDCRIIVIDNCSKDGTRQKLEHICKHCSRVMAIFNSRNYGPVRSPYYGIISSYADCTIQMAADFQDPPEMISQFVEKWEEGYKVVISKKTSSHENSFIYFIRSRYYNLLKKIANIEHIEHFTGFGLYDKSVVDAMRQFDDPYPYLRGIISEIGFERAELEFDQPKRVKGKTKTNFLSLYDIAMLGITSYSKVLMRLATFVGFLIAAICLLISLIYLVLKLIFWSTFPLGTAPLLIGIFFIGSIQLCFIGLLGEYIMSINTRVMHRPLVIEEKRINFIPPK